MTIAKVFQSGNSQAVRLPKEFRFNIDELTIFRRGAEVVLREKRPSVADVLDPLPPWPDDITPKAIPDLPAPGGMSTAVVQQSGKRLPDRPDRRNDESKA
jgi:antitoxin VapB